MKSPFSIAALVCGIALFAAAALVFTATVLNASESDPLAIVAFLLVAIVNIPEMPVGMLVSNIGFPVVLPAVTVILGVFGVQRNEPRRQLAITGIVLAGLSIGLYLLLRVIG